MYEKPPNTTISVGVATKPYPHFRLPGKYVTQHDPRATTSLIIWIRME